MAVLNEGLQSPGIAASIHNEHETPTTVQQTSGTQKTVNPVSMYFDKW